jgi:hypothetical protein
MPLAAAIAIAGVASAGAAIYEGDKASSTAQNVAAQDNALQSQIYQSNKALEQPYVTSGNTAETALNGFLGLGGDPAATQKAFQDYLNSTGYQFARDQGLDAVAGSKAANGLLGSGSLVTALDAYGTGLAQQYGQQYVGNLLDETRIGAGSANALAQTGQQYANASNANANTAATASENNDLNTAKQIGNALSTGVKLFASPTGGSSYLGAANAFTPGIGG